MTEQPAKQPQPIKLDKRYQAGSIVILGIALIVTGVVAVFETEVEAGPVAILGIGFVLFIIGVAKQLPTKLGAGNASMEFPPQVAEAIGDLYAQVPPEGRGEARAALASLANVAPELAGTALTEAAWQELVMQMLAESVATLNELDGEELTLTSQVVIPPADGYGSPWQLDAVIYMPQGAIAIELTHSSGLSFQRRLSAWDEYTRLTNESGGKQYGTMLISKTNEPVPQFTLDRDEPKKERPSGGMGNFLMPVQVRDRSDQEELTQELRTAVHLVKKHPYRGPGGFHR